MRRQTLVALVLLLLAAALRFGPRPDVDDGARWRRIAPERPLVIAHAGGIDLFPANTMVAFEGSAALGVDMLELDLQLTADDALLVMHDDTVDRTTEGSGRVRDLRLVELLALDASDGWTRPDGSDPWAAVRVPPATLEGVLDAFAATGLGFVIELKNAGSDGEHAARLLAEALARHDVEARTIVASFHLETIRAFRTASAGRVTTAGAGDELRVGLIATALGLDALWYRPAAVGVLQLPVAAEGIDLASADFLARAHARGQAVQYWTINDEATMARLLAAGADGIMTDDPALLRRVLADHGHALPEPVGGATTVAQGSDAVGALPPGAGREVAARAL